MRSRFALLLAAPLLLGVSSARAADDPEKLAAQKKAAVANFALVEAGEPMELETTHLILYAPKTYKKKLDDVGKMLEKQFDMAVKPLQVDPKDNKWWAGKLTVYLFDEREHFTAFIRRVEKRRLETDEVGSYLVDTDLPHAAASPPKSDADPNLEVQAAYQVAQAILQKKAGAKVPLPEYLLMGFARATYNRANTGSATGSERNRAAQLVKMGRNGNDVWGGSNLELKELYILRGSLVDFLAYGSQTLAAKFPAFVAGFAPEENQDRKSTQQAMEAAGWKPDAIDKAWQTWLKSR
jgi:hypothetical protein